MNRIDQALSWMVAEFSVAHKDEFRRAHMPQGDMLLDGLLGQGYLRRRGDEVVLTDMGHAREMAVSREASQ